MSRSYKVILLLIRKKYLSFGAKIFYPLHKQNFFICFQNRPILKLIPPSIFRKFKIFFKNVRSRYPRQISVTFEENRPGSYLNHSTYLFFLKMALIPRSTCLILSGRYSRYPYVRKNLRRYIYRFQRYEQKSAIERTKKKKK